MIVKKKRSVVKVLVFLSCVILFCTIFLVAGSFFYQKADQEALFREIPIQNGNMQGLLISTGKNGDFPTRTASSVGELQQQLAQIAEYASTYGYNALFFEAVNKNDTFYRSKTLAPSKLWCNEEAQRALFDPLEYLTEIAKEKGIQVYAFIQVPTVRTVGTNVITEELTKKYNIAGVLLSEIMEGSKNAPSPEEWLQSVAQAIHTPSMQKLGIITTATLAPESVLGNVSDSLDFVVTAESVDPVKKNTEFLNGLSAWQSFCTEHQLAYYPSYAFDERSAVYTAENAILLQRQASVSHMILTGYKNLQESGVTAAASLYAARQQKEDPSMPNLTFAQSFGVTRPTQTLYLDSTWESYFVTGTSVPNVPVTANGQPVTTTESGLWGYWMQLPYGTSTATFAQGEHQQEVVIVRNRPASDAPPQIRLGTVYPSSQDLVLPGNMLQLSCTAPAGSVVTASLGALSVPLQEVPGTVSTISTYKAQLNVSTYAQSGKLTNAGPVTYRLNYNGHQMSQQSEGSILVAGSGVTPIAKMYQFANMVNTYPANDGQYLTILRENCVDEIVENTGSYYKLSVGGYILKNAVQIEARTAPLVNKLTGVALEKTSKGEKLLLSLSERPAYKGVLTAQALTVELRNISGLENDSLSRLESKLCSSITAESNNSGSVTLAFHLRSGVKIAGWDVLFDDNNQMSIYLREKPTIDWNTPTPLSGVTIVLDPGHGGSDPGAMGIPGTFGPSESILNLANAYALRSRLSALGATVQILQENTTNSLDQRLKQTQQADADLFISSHHNSLSETVDASSISGVEVYYWNDLSAQFAQNIGTKLSAYENRPLRNVTQSYYRVTMMYSCPAVLVESGFINNPTEYEKIADPFAMYRYASALTDAILQYFADYS